MALESRSLMTVGFLTGPAAGQPLDIALGYLRQSGSKYGVSASDVSNLIVTDMYTDSVGARSTHIYVRQGLNGLPVQGAELSITVMPDGRILSIGGGFVPNLQATAANQIPQPSMSAASALQVAARALGLTSTQQPTTVSQKGDKLRTSELSAPGISTQPVPSQLSYFATSQGVKLAWSYVIYAAGTQVDVYNAFADASTGALLKAYNWVDHLSDGTYNVYQLPSASPNSGPRTSVTDPYDPVASPYGWHDTNGVAGADTTLTNGNNVSAFVDVNASFNDPANATPSIPQPDGGASLDFNFSLDLSSDPIQSASAAVTNLYYVMNTAHDIHSRYGFDEASGNFQVKNYSGNGQGGDPLHAVEGFGYNNGYTDNAFMFTPPEGQSPVVAMFWWDLTTPLRSGGFDAEVMLHEFGHGISNRLTNGPSDVNALDNVQSGSMGEGWSDFWGLLLTQGATPITTSTVRGVGTYVLGQPSNGPGIRRHPYSYDMSINPITLDDYNGGFPNSEVHNAGEIWTSVLWDMTALLVKDHGYSADIADGYQGPSSAGNVLALQLVMDALKIQPANPTFLDARDAILSADLALTGGENQFAIWSAFARRGFGLSASTSGSDSESVTTATDIPILVTMKSVAPPANLVENQSLGQIPVATFVDPTDASASTATIDWGDGSPIATGTIVSNGGGNYTILAPAKTFQEGGRYTVKVDLDKPGVIKLTRSEIYDVADLPITASGFTFSKDALGNDLTEGSTFNGIIGTFTDSDLDPISAQSYTVTLTWSDDQTQSTGQVVQTGTNQFAIQAVHVLGGGIHDVQIEVTGPGGGTASATSQTQVVDSVLTAVQGFTFTAHEGTPYADAIAAFDDADPRHPPASNYSAHYQVIDPTNHVVLLDRDGTVKANPLGSGYIVTADGVDFVFDAYAYPLQVSVTIGNLGGKTASTTSLVTIEDQPLEGTALGTRATEGQSIDTYIAQFNDLDPRQNPPSRYSAVINWGDGPSPAQSTTTVGTVVVNTDGGYLVRGHFAYARAGNYPISVALKELVGGFTTSVPGTIQVGLAPIGVQLAATASPYEGNAFSDVLAKITTSNPSAVASDFSASIDWGDGTTTSNAPIRLASDGSGFEVLGTNKTYPQVGTFVVGVVVSRTYTNAAPISVTGQIVVRDAPLAASGASLNVVSKTPLSGLKIAHFTDLNPISAIDDFTALVSWGDGTAATSAQIISSPSGGYDVLGSHQYPTSGNFTAVVTINSIHGAAAATTSAVYASPLLFPITAKLAAASASKLAAYATADSTPTIIGTSEPNATVSLYATAAGSTARKLVGTATADASGNWSVVTETLVDGWYALSASAIDTAGGPSSNLTAIKLAGRSLVVDTSGPRVDKITVNARAGTLTVKLVDDGAGLNRATLGAASNYSLIVVGPRGNQKINVSQVAITSSTTATLRFTGLSRFQAGTYVFQMTSAKLTDVAGNALDERFYVPFPSISKKAGQNFIAQFTSDGTTASGIRRFVPPPQVAAARKHARYVAQLKANR